MISPHIADVDFTLYVGDALEVLHELEANTVDCVITSPPYWGLRDYGTEGQFGLEPTPDEYVARLVAIFREVHRVLSPHGTVWLNLGDSYTSGSSGERVAGMNGRTGRAVGQRQQGSGDLQRHGFGQPKNLVGIPWRVAFALQADGWFLRSDIIWAKPNPMPESITDRPTNAHEYVFLLSRRSRYWFDQEAVRVPLRPGSELVTASGTGRPRYDLNGDAAMPSGGVASHPSGRNIRTVWEIATQPRPEAHFATFPDELVRRCLLAGCPEWVCSVCGAPRTRIVEREASVPWEARRALGARSGTLERGYNENHGDGLSHDLTVATRTVGWTDCGHGAYRPGVVLDPFIGSGTTAHVARRYGRRCVGIDLSPDYAALVWTRTQQLSLLAEVLP